MRTSSASDFMRILKSLEYDAERPVSSNFRSKSSSSGLVSWSPRASHVSVSWPAAAAHVRSTAITAVPKALDIGSNSRPISQKWRRLGAESDTVEPNKRFQEEASRVGQTAACPAALTNQIRKRRR